MGTILIIKKKKKKKKYKNNKQTYNQANKKQQQKAKLITWIHISQILNKYSYFCEKGKKKILQLG